ncbi:Pao retrotransposon peptidase family protein [Aphelenchoides avenae]|nr:Pao retrotransposon peptidase family protein [Aphelenchus avenae]
MGAFGATSGSFAHGAPRAAKVNGTNSSAGDDTGDTGDPDSSAYSGSFFVNGELERLIGSTPASSKPLKLVGQAIEKFDGDITKYPVFRQQFLREAHRPGRDTDDVDRFYFLLSLLDGPAKQLVSGIKPLKGCYQLATSTLDQRYGDENEIYRQLLRELKQLKPLQHGCSATQIEQFSMKVVQTLASISDLGRADTSGRTLEEIEEKLPPSLREKIHERKRNDPHWDITKLHAFLLERAAISRAIHGDKVRTEPPDSTKVKTAATAAQQRPGQNRGRPPLRKDTALSPKCVFCPSTAHWGSQCPKYDTLISRISRILELKRCYVCLNEHSSDTCRNPAAKDCRLCNERHHICFCPERYRTDKKASKTHATTHKEVYEDYEEPVSDNVTEEEASSDDEVKEESERVVAENHDAHAVVSDQHNGSHQSTLLECVEVTVAHPTDKTRRCQAVLVFDSCSTQTFIQESLQEKLQLPQLNPVKLSIGTFMSSKDKTVDTFFTQLKIRKSNGKTLQIRAPVLDKLCGEVKSVFMKPQQVAELREGTCALLPSTETPEILIGRDLRHIFEVTEEHEPLPSGFVLSHTNVGSMVVGRGLTRKPTNESEVTDKTFFTRGVVIEPKQNVSLGQLLHAEKDEKPGDMLQQMHSLVLHADGKSDQLAEAQLESILQQLHSLEQMGVEPPDAQNEDDAIHKRIRDSIRWVDGRYEVGLPWRTTDGKAPSNADLPDNFAYAFACLQALIKTLSKSPELLAEYDKIFKEYLASGIISEVAKDTKFTTHYLSHHAVIKKTSATTKTRPVYNGSAKPDKASLSLNDWLHKGPLLLNPITAVLLNSRLAPYVLSADIAKAFLQISLREEDRQVCRFLWVRDTNKPATGENLVIYCFNRVIFGLRPSPALLGVSIEHHMEAENTALSREVLANCYVDNIYLTADDIEEASDKYRASKQMFADMNMNLREYATNDASFNASLPKEDQAKFDGFKQLGVNWDLNSDEWVFNFRVGSLTADWCPKPRKGQRKNRAGRPDVPTKRLMSSTMLSRFDPLGLVSPAILPARLAVQATCKAKYGWDDPVDTKLLEQWNKAIECWASTEIRVPRLIKPKGHQVAELHVFCDASGHSYGAAAYLVVQASDGTRSSNLIFSRSRLKALNTNLTIPRLELMAATLGARLVDFLQKQLTTKVSNITLWTDSQVVFFWIQSKEKQPVFVENRLREIRILKGLHNICIKYVPTEDNPADVLSRGISASKLQEHQLWWKGPRFLGQSDVTTWPVQPTLTEYEETEQPFEAVVERELAAAISSRSSRLGYIVDPAGFNDWEKFLYKTYEYLFNIVLRMRTVSVKRQSTAWIPTTFRPLVEDITLFKPNDRASLKDLHVTETFVLKTTQSQYPPSSEDERQLRLSYDENGLLRASSRLTQSTDVPSSAYNPVYLPRKARVTELLIHFHHDTQRHLGTNATLASLRRRFWFTSGRRTTQQAVRRLCKECAIWNAKPLKIPEWPVLPASRVNRFKPFSHIGLDNFGSYTVKDTINDHCAQRKVWVLIVSCLTTRAIWMDVVPDMTAESFINAFKRHMASNGTPYSVICDNATNFVAGGEALRRVSEQGRPVAQAEDVRRSLRQAVRRRQLHEVSADDPVEGNSPPIVEFNHIPEYAPWRGATYERLIGNAKYCLKRAIGRKILTLDEFRTLIAEVTRAVNERPIAYMSDKVEDFTLLRPLDFLAPLSQDRPVPNPTPEERSKGDLKDPTYHSKKPSAVDKLVEMWTEQARRLETFWSLWHERILLNSLERGTGPDKTTRNKRPQGRPVDNLIGQYVLVKDDNAPQYKWKRAEILDVIESSDGIIRTASIRLPSGTVSRRAINHLYPIEVELEPVTVSSCRVTQLISGSPMGDYEFANMELDYDELETFDEASAQPPNENSDGSNLEPGRASITDANLQKAYEINGRVIMASSGPIPLLDSHLHVDEVAAYARKRRLTPPSYTTWSRDPSIGQSYRFAGYITVFCRPDTYLSDEHVRRASASDSYPLDSCLGACVGVHPGNSEDWHLREDMRQQLASILLRGSIGQYHIVGLGECGLDYTKKAPIRNDDGTLKMRDDGSIWLSHSINEKRKHQMPVFEGQLTLAKQLGRPDGRRYPLVFHLRDYTSMNTDVQRDALEAMAKVQLPKDYPIHFHFWSGDLGQYERWIEQYPQTLFGINSGHLKQRLTPEQLEFLQTVPLNKVAFESDAPHHGSVGTTQSMGTPAGLVWAIRKFKELGNRPEDERTIAQRAMENTIRLYRPDLHIVTLPVPVPLATSRPEVRPSVSASSASSGPVIHSKGHTPPNRPDTISDNTYSMFELTSVCDAECVGPHIRCTSVYLVSDGRREGTILGRDWNHVLTGLIDVPNLRNSKVFSVIQLVLCCWAGRLLRDRPQEMMQFLQELLGRPAHEAAAVLNRWYQQITASSGRNFRQVTESDVKLALRKRFHGCRVAHSWLKKVQPPFRYECQLTTIGLQPEVQDAVATINRVLPDALAATYHQFVTRCSSLNEGAGQFSRYHDQSSITGPDAVADLQLVEEERYDEDDQPGSSRKSQTTSARLPDSSARAKAQASSASAMAQTSKASRLHKVQNGQVTKQASLVGMSKKGRRRGTKKQAATDSTNQLMLKMIQLFLEHADSSGSGPIQASQRRFSQTRTHRGAQQ